MSILREFPSCNPDLIFNPNSDLDHPCPPHMSTHNVCVITWHFVLGLFHRPPAIWKFDRFDQRKYPAEQRHNRFCPSSSMCCVSFSHVVIGYRYELSEVNILGMTTLCCMNSALVSITITNPPMARKPEEMLLSRCRGCFSTLSIDAEDPAMPFHNTTRWAAR
jgi:hypothetical protein